MKQLQPVPGAKKWEGSKADKENDKKKGLKEDSAADIKEDNKYQKKLNDAVKKSNANK